MFYFNSNPFLANTKKICFIAVLFSINIIVFSQNANNKFDDSDMLDQYIKAKGYASTIVFDQSNIKRYWIHSSVLADKQNITISLNQQNAGLFESAPLKLQLMNVTETQSCRVEVITTDKDFGFSVFSDLKQKLSDSSQEQDFINYHILSSTFNLEDTKDFSFQLKFNSAKDSIVKIDKIILTFFENKQTNYLGSSGFQNMIKQIEENGSEASSEYNVKYILDKEHNKLFIRIPRDLAESQKFFWHIYPVDKKDLLPGRETTGFNNIGFSLNQKYRIIPPNYSSDADCVIIQVPLPTYEFSLLRFGQFDSSKRIWTISVNQ